MKELLHQLLKRLVNPNKLDCVPFNQQTPGRQVSGPFTPSAPGGKWQMPSWVGGCCWGTSIPGTEMTGTAFGDAFG